MDINTGVELAVTMGACIVSILGAAFYLGRKVQVIINSIETLNVNVTTLEELIGEETKNIWCKIDTFGDRLDTQGIQLEHLTENVETICNLEREG